MRRMASVATTRRSAGSPSTSRTRKLSGVYASMTSVTGAGADVESTAAMAAESMVAWLRQFDGYRGMIVLSDAGTGTAQIVTFWDTKENLERSARSRTEVRIQMIETAGAELEGVHVYAVVYRDGFESLPT
jgi:heme-degrading monooxygenase HmoA